MVEIVFMKNEWLRSNILKGRLWAEKKGLKGLNKLKKLGYLFFIISIYPFMFYLFKNKLRKP